MTDQAFFDALNTELAGLEDTKQHVAAGDWARARQALYRYVRGKFRRAGYHSPPEVVDGKLQSDPGVDYVSGHSGWWAQEGMALDDVDDPVAALLGVADEFALEGRVRFHSTGNRYEFDPSKPFDYIDFDPTGREYHEPLQLYALYDVRALRDAYSLSGNPAHLRRAEEMLASYCRWFAGGASGALAASSSAGNHPWDAWGVSRRLFGYVAFLSFLEETDLDPDLVVDVMKVLLEDQRLHVSRGPTWGGNWRQFMCNHGAGIAAVFFEFKEAPEWFANQVDLLLMGSSDLFPDGSMSDFSTSYTDGYLMWQYNLSRVLMAFANPQRLDIPPDIAARYERTIDWQLAMRKPDGRSVSFNDDGSKHGPEYYGRLAGVVYDYFGRADLRWFANGGKRGRQPALASFPATSTTPSYCGMHAMRSDWTSSARYLAVDFGPNGGHAHPDYGSFVLHAYGADLIDEGGCAAYGSEPYANYSTKPWAHNILGIDGVTQPPDRPPMGEPIHNWITNSAYDYTWGRSDFGAATGDLQGVIHHRGIYFAKPDYFILLDAIDGRGRHRIRSKLQLAWDVTAEVHETTVEARSDRGASLWIVPLDSRSTPAIITAQKEPIWEGWMSKVTHTNEVEPAPSIVYEEERNLPTYQETLLYPVAAGRQVKLETERIFPDGGADRGVLLQVSPADRPYRDEFIFGWGRGTVRFASRGLTLDGQLAHLRHQGEKLDRIAFIRVREISLPVNGAPITIRFDAATDGYIELGRRAGMANARVFLDLANRRDAVAMTIEQAGEGAARHEVPVGEETTL